MCTDHNSHRRRDKRLYSLCGEDERQLRGYAESITRYDESNGTDGREVGYRVENLAGILRLCNVIVCICMVILNGSMYCIGEAYGELYLGRYKTAIIYPADSGYMLQ